MLDLGGIGKAWDRVIVYSPKAKKLGLQNTNCEQKVGLFSKFFNADVFCKDAENIGKYTHLGQLNTRFVASTSGPRKGRMLRNSGLGWKNDEEQMTSYLGCSAIADHTGR